MNGTVSQRCASTATLLPSELWDYVLGECTPPSNRQASALALSRALPASGASRIHLFAHIRITRDERQANQLFHRLGPRRDDAAELLAAIRTCSVDCWRPDPDLTVNIISAMTNLLHIDMLVGPMWNPDPFEDLLAKPYRSLRRLSLRFNPYVRKKSFWTFLAGKYYDVALERLARWPALPDFTTLSFVQDPLPRLKREMTDGITGHLVPDKFAQPLVLFKTFCISSFAASDAAQHIRYLRMRIPSRSILASLTSASTSTTVHTSDLFSTVLPSLRLLDLSTSYVPLGPALKALLLRHSALQHLIIDRTGFTGAEDLQALALTASSIGVARAKEAHRAWRALLVRKRDIEAVQAASVPTTSTSGGPIVPTTTSRTRRTGRSGFASETAPAARRRQAAASEGTTSSTPSLARYRNLPLSFYIIPSESSFRSICCGDDRYDAEDAEDCREAFAEGWTAGLERVEEMREEQLKAYRRPATHGALNGRKVLMRFADPGEPLPPPPSLDAEDEEERAEADAWEELKRSWRMIETTEEEIHRRRAMSAATRTGSSCVLCLVPDCAGDGVVAWSDGSPAPMTSLTWRPAPDGAHTVGCGHLVARRVFEAEID